MTGRLFEVEPVIDQADGVELSAGRRLTLRNNTDLARGVHPATRRPLIQGRTCGGCALCVKVGRFWKCERHRLGKSRSASSDIRLSWPGCDLFTTTPTPKEA